MNTTETTDTPPQPPAVGAPLDQGVRPDAATFAGWYAENERYLTTQPYTNYVAAAAWNDGQSAEREKWLVALGACDAALAQCQPCADPECGAVQRDYIETARAAAAALLRA